MALTFKPLPATTIQFKRCTSCFAFRKFNRSFFAWQLKASLLGLTKPSKSKQNIETVPTAWVRTLAAPVLKHFLVQRAEIDISSSPCPSWARPLAVFVGCVRTMARSEGCRQPEPELHTLLPHACASQQIPRPWAAYWFPSPLLCYSGWEENQSHPVEE